MSKTKILTLAALLAAVVCLGPVQDLFAQQKDAILRKDTGKKMTVDRIISETYEEVRYQRGSTEGRISLDKVTNLEYYDRPAAFDNGLSFVKKGEYENALNSFTLAMEEKGVRTRIKTYCLFEIAKLNQQWGLATPGKFKDAVAAYQAFLTHDPESRFYPEALLNFAICQAASRDLASALETFDRLAQEAYDKKFGVIWEAKAKLEKALARLDGGGFDDAERDFRSAMTFATEQAKSPEDPAVGRELSRMASLARLYQGTVMIKKKKYNEARQFFEAIVRDETSSRDAKAGAECGLGECLMSEGMLKDAQIQFARAKVLYADIPDAGGQATYYLGQICLDLKDKEPSHKKRAREYFNEVLEIYADTEWAKKAKAKTVGE